MKAVEESGYPKMVGKGPEARAASLSLPTFRGKASSRGWGQCRQVCLCLFRGLDVLYM